MNLFDETENKYYDFVSYLISRKQNISDKEIRDRMLEINSGEIDVPVFDAIFSKNEGKNSIFEYNEKGFQFMLDDDFPIRLNSIEKEALLSVLDFVYAEGFIDCRTIKRISDMKSDDVGWSLNDIIVRNQDVREKQSDLLKKISVIVEGIRSSRALSYDNIKDGIYSFVNRKAWPVKLEYSYVNDVFRLCAFLPDEDRYIKMNLSTLENIKLEEMFSKDLESGYIEFMRENTKMVVLEVDPVQHVIERCFRLFSFYDRQAIYDSDKEKYRLKLKYYRFDEAEVLRDIMSLGSGAIVIEGSVK